MAGGLSRLVSWTMQSCECCIVDEGVRKSRVKDIRTRWQADDRPQPAGSKKVVDDVDSMRCHKNRHNWHTSNRYSQRMVAEHVRETSDGSSEECCRCQSEIDAEPCVPLRSSENPTWKTENRKSENQKHIRWDSDSPGTLRSWMFPLGVKKSLTYVWHYFPLKIRSPWTQFSHVWKLPL